MSMPIITLNLLKELLAKEDRPVTTNEIINHVADRSPRNLDNLVSNMVILEKAGFLKKGFDKEKKSYVWELSDPSLNGREILEKYPELYEQTLYGEDSLNMFKKKKK
jgi:hypothetical protein